MPTVAKPRVKKDVIEKLAARMLGYFREFITDTDQGTVKPWAKQDKYQKDRIRFVARRLIEEGL